MPLLQKVEIMSQNPSKMAQRQMARRTFLRGIGTAVALPWLESLLPGGWISHTAAATGEIASPPRRTAFLFIPNGVHMPDWSITEVEGQRQFSSSLKPLEKVFEDVLLVRGLSHRNAKALGDGPGDHARSSACFLTGAHPYKTAGADIRSGLSIDQVLANSSAGETLIPSLQLGTEGGRQSGNCDSGYSCAYSSNISWAQPDRPIPHEIQPRRVFERLFLKGPAGETAAARQIRIHRRSSILDFVREDAAGIQRSLGHADRGRFDEFLSGIRDLERRIDRLEELDALEKQEQGLTQFEDLSPTNYQEHVRLMNELMLLAFRLDLTRVITFMWSNEGTNRTHPHLDIGEGHHILTHHKGNEEQINRVRKINHWQVSEFARLVERMKEIREGEQSLLESTTLVFGSAISDGNRHNHDDLPVIIAGQGGGLIETGRVLKTPNRTPMCNLFLSLAQAEGQKIAQFGDSKGVLPGLKTGF